MNDSFGVFSYCIQPQFRHKLMLQHIRRHIIHIFIDTTVSQFFIPVSIGDKCEPFVSRYFQTTKHVSLPGTIKQPLYDFSNFS